MTTEDRHPILRPDGRSPAFAPAPEPTALTKLAAQFVDMARVLLAAESVGEVLQNVVQAAHRVVPGADLVSVTVRDGNGNYTTPACTDSRALELDQIQYRHGEGPCVAATAEGGPDLVLSCDLGEDERWPKFGPAAAEEGFRSLLAVGLLPGGGTARSGALNIYAHEPGQLGDEDRDLAVILAAHASTALAATTATAEIELHAAQFAKALRSRDVIGQAKGILMERRHLTADEAFNVLVRASQDLNRKLADIAEALVRRHEAV
jgi:GAF domain-containing protein